MNNFVKHEMNFWSGRVNLSVAKQEKGKAGWDIWSSLTLITHNNIITEGIVQTSTLNIIVYCKYMGMRFCTLHIKVHSVTIQINRGQGTMSSVDCVIM